MPRIKVIIKGGQEVLIEGASEANWYDINQNWTAAPSNADLLIVVAPVGSDGNRKEMGKFKASEVVGYVVDPKE